MGLADINGEKLSVPSELLVDSDKIADLAPKRRSGVTAEDEDQRPLADSFVQVKRGSAIEYDNLHIWGCVPDAQFSLAHVRKSKPHQSVEVPWPSREQAECHERRN
jgi:hypothetical protein